jgi:hypothetical protein
LTSVVEWLRQRRRLQAQDGRSARLAELHHIQAVAAEAERLVGTGWTQGTWYGAVDERGRPRVVDPQRTTSREAAPPFARACLVGAIVHAAGGPGAVRSQLTSRTLELTWHSLFRAADQPVQWCSPPAVRQARVRDLTQWNDSPSRRVEDVLDLLRTTRMAAATQASRLQHEAISG